MSITTPVADHTPTAPLHPPSPPDVRGSNHRAAPISLALALVVSGLFAGFFFTYSISVQLGLAEVDDLTYVRTFQAINATIRNAPFGFVFFGCVPSIAAALALHRRARPAVVASLAIATACCLAVAIITFTQNVPLNDQLAAYTDLTEANAALARDEFETTWNRWNLARTLLSIAGAVAMAVAATLRRRA